LTRIFLALFFVAWAGSVPAVEPGEVMSNLLLEERARSISKSLRCLQCRNESIDESNSGIASDLRVLVRTRLADGDSDQEVVSFIVSRYGEYVLLRPSGKGINIVLWLSGPFLFLVGIFCLYLVRNKAKNTPVPSPLTDQEEEKIKKISLS
jgi:cytochrome c-type biogenesis protein CcmH